MYTCKNQLLPVVHHHLGSTQICRRWSHFHINHIAVWKWNYHSLSTGTLNCTNNNWTVTKQITLGLKYSWTWKVATGRESMLMSHSWKITWKKKRKEKKRADLNERQQNTIKTSIMSYDLCLIHNTAKDITELQTDINMTTGRSYRNQK